MNLFHRHQWTNVSTSHRTCTCGLHQILEHYPDGTQQWVSAPEGVDDIEDFLWKQEVERNTHNQCVWCGAPMVTTVFFDVPVCAVHNPQG